MRRLGFAISWQRGLVAGLIVLLAAWLAASPLLAGHALRQAVINNDHEALAAWLDQPALVVDIREQLAEHLARSVPEDAAMRDISHGMLREMFYIQLARPVGELVTPANLVALFRGEASAAGALADELSLPRAGEGAQPFAEPVMGYRSWNRFAIHITASQDRDLILYLHRRGLHWRLASVGLPLE